MADIAIIGPGAIGATIAVHLTRAGHDVTVCARTPVDALAVDTPDGLLTASPIVLTDSADARPVDWVLVCTKTYDGPAAARWLAPLTGPDTRVAVLQNGVDHRARFAGLVAPDRLVPVIVDIPAERTAPGRVIQHRHGTLTVPADANGNAFADLFAATPITAITTVDWRTVAWRKLAINSCGIALTLILKPFGATHDPGVAAVMRVLIEECAAVGRAEGADLPVTIADEVIAYYRAQVPTLLNSMHADRVAGRPLELDARDGVVVRLGRQHGIATPAHAIMIDLLMAAIAC